jgi:hypothetical protein
LVKGETFPDIWFIRKNLGVSPKVPFHGDPVHAIGEMAGGRGDIGDVKEFG